MCLKESTSRTKYCENVFVAYIRMHLAATYRGKAWHVRAVSPVALGVSGRAHRSQSPPPEVVLGKNHVCFSLTRQKIRRKHGTYVAPAER